MSQERTEGVVLRGVDFSESSRIVTFLTPDRGKLACMAAGVKRPKSELAALLDTFNRVELVYYWKESRSVQKLASATMLDGFAANKADLDKTMYGSVALELAYKVAHEGEPSAELYESLVTGLESLGRWPGGAETHACWQLIGLLAAAGFEPSLDARGTGFSYDTGLVAGPADMRLTRADADALVRLGAAEACPDMEAPRPVFTALVRYAERHVESNFRSARVIESMYAR